MIFEVSAWMSRNNSFPYHPTDTSVDNEIAFTIQCILLVIYGNTAQVLLDCTD